MTDSAQSNVNRITVGKAAKLLGVSSSTLRRLEDSGKINSQREEENNYRFYLEEDVLGLKAELAREKVEAQVARVNSIPVEKPIVNVAGPTSRVTLAKPTVIRAKTPVATATVATAKVANAQTQDPFYTNFKKNINLITAGFAGASLLLMIFSFFMLAPYKTKTFLAEKATQAFDSTGGKLAQLLNIEIQETSPFSQPIEKQMMAAVLGVRTRNPEYQVEFNVPVLANKLVTFQEGASINGTITLDTVAKTSLENTLELTGDASGTLSNVTINNLGGLALGTIEGDDGNLLYIDNGEIISGTLSDLDTTEITELGTIETGTWEADVIDVGYGGTGLTSFSTGDLIYASASSTLSPLNVGTNGHILTVTNGLPVWANVSTTLGGNVYLNGGNTFGANATLGTLDAYSLALMTNNVSRLTIASTGDITINPSNEIIFRGENLYASVLGTRTYTDQRFVTNGETLTASIDALDLVVQDVVSGELGMWQRTAGTSINPATYTSLVITDTGRLGIGTTAPTATLDVKGDILLGDTNANTIEFVARVKEGTALVPETDISSDLGAPDYRFNNIYVANINSNSQLTSTGQAIFTYEPTDVTYAESTVRINPTSPLDQSYLLGLGVYGYQRAGFDTDGDLSLGYSGLDSIPTTNNPLNIYGHNATLVSTVDTSGNAYFAGTLGLGTTSPSAQLHVVGTTEQLRLAYDATNYTSFTIGSTGELTISDSGTTVAVLGATGASFQVPTSFNAAGDVSIANDLVFTNQETANIKSYGPLYIESGENFENNDLTLKTYGTGNVALDLTGTGYLHLLGTDPSIVFDTRTATDTDFWMGVQEDGAGTDDDKFMLGKGTVLGTSSLLTINSSGYLGLGTTSPQAMLHVTGSTIFGTSIADTMTFNARLASGSSLVPAVDLGSDLGAASYRFNNIYVANINSNSELTSSGQAIFTYSPADTTWTESTVRINPTTAPSGSWLLGMGVGGNQVAGIKNDGGAYFAGSVGIGTTAPGASLDIGRPSTGTIFKAFRSDSTGFLSLDFTSNASNFYSNSDYIFNTNNKNMRFDAFSGGLILGFNVSGLPTGVELAVNQRVGIGTTAPTEALHVVGNILATGTITNSSLTMSTTNITSTSGINLNLADNAGANSLNIRDSDESNLFSINSLGALTQSGASAAFSLDNGAGDAFTVTNAGAGLSFRVNDVAGDTTPFVIDGAGNVGIGTTAPTSKLDVSGTITATGFVLPTGAVAGYVLSTDADGNATWVDGSYSGDAWAVSGTNVSLDDPSFLIGIGTTAPDAKLTIVGETASAITTWYNSLGTKTAVFDESFADFSVPTSFGAVGDTTINGDLNFADLNYSKITSQGDLYITAGSAFRDSNIYLEPLGRGEVFASSNLLVDGDVEASGTFVSDAGFDLAEVYDTYNAELEPGDLVMIAGDMGGATGGTDSGSSGGATVEKANFMKRDSLVGIVSTKPGFTLGGGAFKEQVKSAEANPEEATKTPVLIALAGRVPVKVSLENGEIKAGDALTIGFIDGVAAKARTNGMIVARALEGYTLADKAEGKETIIAMVQTNWWQSSGGQTAEDFALDWEIASSNLAVIQEATQGMSGTTSYTSGSSSTNTEDSGVLGESTFYNTSITGDLTVGLLKVDSLENSIGIIGAPCYNAQTGVTNQDLCQTQTLYLQKGLSGGVDMFNGRIEFNPNGTIKAKSIYADVVEAKEFRAAGNVGVATIKAGTTEFFVENKSTAGASRVFVTPNSPVVVAVKKLEAGKGFVLEINEALSKDLKVDWWLIN